MDRGALDADDVAPDVGDVEAEGDVRVTSEVAQLALAGLAVEQDVAVVANEEPHGHGVGPPVRAHRREPGHQVGVQAAVDALASDGGQRAGQVGGGGHDESNGRRRHAIPSRDPWEMAGTMTVVSEAVLYHFSEDAEIRVFRPHTPATNPDHRPAIWAIEAAGQWTAETPVEPLDVVAIPDLLEAHVAAGDRVEVRAEPVAGARSCHPRRLGLQHRADAQRTASSLTSVEVGNEVDEDAVEPSQLPLNALVFGGRLGRCGVEVREVVDAALLGNAERRSDDVGVVDAVLAGEQRHPVGERRS